MVLSPAEMAALKSRDSSGRLEMKIDLEKCEISSMDGFRAHFAIDPFRRTCLLEGLDEIGMTLKHEAEILAYEQCQRASINAT
jgi:3-isopropylmalate/(R)-2-methylmalate dehydratase small subunit